MEQQKLYRAIGDPYYAEPYIDKEEWRDEPIRHYYVHGGFKGTEKMGQEVKFCIYFPPKEQYEGRFYQYVSPAPESEHESENLRGEADKISFCVKHGAYYVVSNQGGFVLNDGERIYKSNANCAQYSREVAKRVYGYDHRPYGYIFGGSGGSFKTMSCIEVTEGVWDGGAPYVLANPMATPNVFAPRVRVMRLLGDEGIAKLVDAMLPGGKGDAVLDEFDEFQKQAVIEASQMGFPKRAWIEHPYMGDGSLMVLAPTIYQLFPTYFEDFWTKEGYAGADPNSSEARDRVQFVTRVKALVDRENPVQTGENNNVDNSWINLMTGNQTTPHIVVEEMPPEGSYLFHCRLRVMSGAAAGKEQPIDRIEGNMIVVSSAFDGQNSGNALEGLAVGDEIMIDNSDYLAMQTFEYHQVPDESYYVYDQFRNEDGTPKYPQLPILIAPNIAMSAGGSVPNGRINSKIIVNCSLLDESAYPWHGDWYRKKVKEAKGDEHEWMRLYYNDNCIHGDIPDEEGSQTAATAWKFISSYLGMLDQSLLDLADWVEKGIEPPESTEYEIQNGQVIVENAGSRKGLQPAVRAWANGEKCVTVKVGERVHFTAEIEAPVGAVTEAQWDVEKIYHPSKTVKVPLQTMVEDGSAAACEYDYAFEEAGTFFVVVRVASHRNGDADDIYTQCRNLDTVRVIVEE